MGEPMGGGGGIPMNPGPSCCAPEPHNGLPEPHCGAGPLPLPPRSSSPLALRSPGWPFISMVTRRPASSAPCRRRTACSAWSGFTRSTNPKPLERPVSLSTAIRAWLTLILSRSKRLRKSSSRVLKDKLPTKSVSPAGLAPSLELMDVLLGLSRNRSRLSDFRCRSDSDNPPLRPRSASRSPSRRLSLSRSRWWLSCLESRRSRLCSPHARPRPAAS
mmetsp:Transcript_73817/g.216628  ORF Transcript_73817/g.216628 Transcript_73817/m.216628 type:complete len:217 (-) Transcript_73817:121-771(-)